MRQVLVNDVDVVSLHLGYHLGSTVPRRQTNHHQTQMLDPISLNPENVLKIINYGDCGCGVGRTECSHQ